MAMVRRHWRLFVVNLVLGISLVLGLLLWQSMRPGSFDRAALAQSGPENPPAANPLDPVAYARVQAVRQSLALTNDDLAALGCTQAQAEAVLQAVRTWTQTNAAAIAETASAMSSAQDAYRDGSRAEAMGGLPQTPISQLASSVQRALVARKTLLDQAATTAEAALAANLRSSWQHRRTNASLPLRYRSVGDLSAAEIMLLQLAVARGNVQAIAAFEETTLTGNRATAVQTAAVNAFERGDDVVLADAAVVPHLQ